MPNPDELTQETAIYLLVSQAECEALASGVVPGRVQVSAAALAEDITIRLQRNAERPLSQKRKSA